MPLPSLLLFACSGGPSGAYINSPKDIEGAWFTDVEDLGLDLYGDPQLFVCDATIRLEVFEGEFFIEYSSDNCDVEGPIRTFSVCEASVPAEGLLYGGSCVNTTESFSDGEQEITEEPGPELRFYPAILYPDGLLLRDWFLAPVD